VLSLVSALIQALIAISIMGVAAVLLGATAKMMGDPVRWIETASYLLTIALDARLLLVKAKGFLAALRETLTVDAVTSVASAASSFSRVGFTTQRPDNQDHCQSHQHATHDHHGHVHADPRSHSHGPQPQMLAGPGGWSRGISAVVAVGLRPCSGGILVLVFALAQGLFPLGVAARLVMGLGTAITVATIATFAVGAKGLALRVVSRRAGYGALAMRGLECAAAATVRGFGCC
jgi:nickel/cobalt transporter (NicO) family protein